ncbi:MAG: hypothetical protein OIF36_00955 [Alphaproteobacteria bacterium]|jgi:hypothetical protein|nr:hypothetical protein [Alphaproteobacteria bacterium]MCV6599039.1 hypothetical protein [Alphaproteobacteria bacterium]
MDCTHIRRLDQEFVIRMLDVRDLAKSHALLNEVAQEMANQDKKYLHKKTLSEVRNMLLNDSHKMAGVFSLGDNGQEDTLVAEIGYFGVDANSPRDNTDAVLPNFKADNVANNDINFIGSVCTKKEFRGLGLLKDLDKFLEERSERGFSVCMVDTKNYRSFGHFLDAGFFLTQKTVDPDDGGNIFYFIKDLKRNDFRRELLINTSASIPVESSFYDQFLNSSLRDGLVGAKFNKEQKRIDFIRADEVLNHFGCNNKTNRPSLIRKETNMEREFVYA